MNVLYLKDLFINSFVRLLNSQRDYSFRIIEQSDKIIVWVVGFSIGAIALSISSIEILSEISNNLHFYIILLSSLTVIFGVLYRLFLYISQQLDYQIMLYLGGYLESFRLPQKSPASLPDGVTSDEIIEYAKKDFNIDLSPFVSDLREILGEEEYHQKCLSMYNATKKWYDEEYNYQVDEIKKFLEQIYPKRMIDKMFSSGSLNRTSILLYWIFLYSASLLFILSISCFLVGIVIFIIAYTKHTICA